MLHPEIDLLVEEETKVVIKGITIIEIILDQIIEIDQEADGTIIGQVIAVTITRVTIDKADQITGKMLSGHLETEVIVEVELEIMITTIQEVEVETDMMTDIISQDRVGEMTLDLDPILE